MSNDEIQSQRVVAQGGLNTLSNYLTLSSENPGAATELQNFESSLSGGYRRISGFEYLDADFSEPLEGSSGPILGIWAWYNTNDGEYQILVAREVEPGDPPFDVANYAFFNYSSSVGWQDFVGIGPFVINHATNGNVVTRIRGEMFNHGDHNAWVFVDGVNPALVYDGDNWYQLTSSGTGGSGSPGGDQILDAPSVVTTFKNHIFLSGDVSHPAIVCHSAPNDSLTWTAAAGGGQIISDVEVVQIKPFRDELFIFGEAAIKKVITTSDPDAPFAKFDVTKDLGCIARDSVIEVGGNLLFLSQDGIRPIAGTDKISDVELGLLSEDIQDIIDAYNADTVLSDLQSVVIKSKTQFRYFYSNGDDAVADSIGIIGCARTRNHAGAQSAKKWEFGTLMGIRANVTWSGIFNGQELILHGDYDGKVYKQESSFAFNGEPIPAIYSSPYLDMGATTIRKSMRTLQTFIKPEGNATINIGIRYDWGEDDVINPSNYVIEINSGVVYDNPDNLYDDADVVYANLMSGVFKTNIQGSCQSVRYIYSTNDTSASYTIHGFVQEFTPRGRQ